MNHTNRLEELEPTVIALGSVMAICLISVILNLAMAVY